jgi:hypothetical protein
MWAQGVPAVIMISREIRDFRSHYVSTCDRYDSQFQQLKHFIDERLQALPQQVVDIIRGQLVVEGAVQVTSADIRRIVSELLEAPGGKMDEISSAIRLLSQSLTSISSQQLAASGDRTTTSQQPQPFSTTGQVHYPILVHGQSSRVT